MWRQGDVLIQLAHEVPLGAVPREALILAEGEATGHAHRIADPASALLFQEGDVLFLNITAAEATVVHEEHGPITLKQGVYRVWRQREYAPQMPRVKLKTKWVRD